MHARARTVIAAQRACVRARTLPELGRVPTPPRPSCRASLRRAAPCGGLRSPDFQRAQIPRRCRGRSIPDRNIPQWCIYVNTFFGHFAKSARLRGWGSVPVVPQTPTGRGRRGKEGLIVNLRTWAIRDVRFQNKGESRVFHGKAWPFPLTSPPLCSENAPPDLRQRVLGRYANSR